MKNLENKIIELGGITYLEKSENEIENYLVHIEKTMNSLPEKQVIDFSRKYGFSIFKNKVSIKSVERSSFINNGKIDLGIIYGFGKYKNNIKKIIETYYIEEQINYKFYPICEGHPGDIIFYSLEKNTFGKIYYWHHESDISKDILLIANSFMDFIEGLNCEIEEEKFMEELSDEELKNINEKRRKVGLPLIDKYRNQL